MAIHRLQASQPYLPVILIGNQSLAEAIGLIDTGASITAVHPDIIKRIDPLKIGAVEVSRVGKATRWEPTYYCKMGLGLALEFGLEVIAAVPASPCDVLIGRDLLARWVLSWDGMGDQLLISY
jgi:hypothetical protein